MPEPPAHRRRRRGPSSVVQAILLVLLIAAGLAGWRWTRSADDPQWLTAIVARGNIETSVAAIGTLQPVRSVDVGAQVSGQVTRIHVQPGDTVVRGQLLAEVDASVLAATVEAGRAEIASLRAQLDDARAQRELAEQQHARQQQMAREEATRLEDVQTAVATRKSAGARVAQYEAQIRQTSASLRADEARLGYSRLYAPIAGVVTGIDVKEGQTLNAVYQIPTVMRIADLSRMTVWTDVSEADIRQVKAGMPASFGTLGGDRRRWRGTVRQVLPAPPTVPAGQAPGAAGSSAGGGSGGQAAAMKAVQYTVLFDVDNSDGVLMPQMTAQVTVVAASSRDVLTAPLSAFKPILGPDGLPTDTDLYEARVVAGKGDDAVTDIETREVRLGVRDRLQVEVLAGLAAGERVITGEVVTRPAPRRIRW